MINEICFNRIKESLDIFLSQMKKLESSREKLIKDTREIISLCSKSIVLLHNNNLSESNDLLQKAFTQLTDLKQYVLFDLDRYLWPAEQEYVEAVILKEILEKKTDLSNHQDLKVSINPYVTGLLDCIGEIKRMLYDILRKNDFEYSLELFSTMQILYDMIYPFAYYDNIVPGLRKKLDISKRIIEDVRVTISEESRRRDFIKKLELVSK